MRSASTSGLATKPPGAGTPNTNRPGSQGAAQRTSSATGARKPVAKAGGTFGSSVRDRQ